MTGETANILFGRTTEGREGSHMTLTGRCLCGGVRYSVNAEPEAMAYKAIHKTVLRSDL